MASVVLRKIWASNIAAMDKRFSDKAALVFLRLIDRSNSKTGDCFPSEELMALELNCTDRTIRNALKPLKKYGYIEILHKRGPNGCNRYRVWLPSGNSEYVEAVKSLLKNRKKNAAKPKKEPKEEKWHGTSPFGMVDSLGTDCTEKRQAELLSQIEAEVLFRLGGNEEAWAKMLVLGAEAFERAADSVLAGAPLDRVAKDLADNVS